MHRLDVAERSRANGDDTVKRKFMVRGRLQILLRIGDTMKRILATVVVLAIVAIVAHELIVTTNYVRFLTTDCDPANDWLTHYALPAVREIVRLVATNICY